MSESNQTEAQTQGTSNEAPTSIITRIEEKLATIEHEAVSEIQVLLAQLKANL